MPRADLALSVSLSAGRLFAGAPPWLMMVSASLALAGWDLALLDLASTENSPVHKLSLL